MGDVSGDRGASVWAGLRQVELSSGAVEYAETGEGPPVVLLHGLVMNHTQWDRVLPLLPHGFRYLRPVLPLGGHRVPMRPGADLGMEGLVRLVAELLDALDLEDVTLVHTDWGGGLFLTAHGLDGRVGRLAVFPCELWDNFPPGLPGRMAVLAARVPGGLTLAARQLRVAALRRSPLLLGRMAKHGVPHELATAWTDGLLAGPGVRRDLRTYLTAPLDLPALCRDTDALARFEGPVLVAWCPENRLMPAEHGRRLAELVADSTYVDIPDAFVLPMVDNPVATARHLGAFLTEHQVTAG